MSYTRSELKGMAARCSEVEVWYFNSRNKKVHTDYITSTEYSIDDLPRYAPDGTWVEEMDQEEYNETICANCSPVEFEGNILVIILPTQYKPIEEIAEEEGLSVVETTEGANGYPHALDKALIGFEDAEQMREVAEKYGLTYHTLYKRAGQQLWNHRYGDENPFDMGKIYEYDNCEVVYPMDGEIWWDDNKERVLEMMRDMDSPSSALKIMEEVTDICNELDCLGDNQIMVIFDGFRYETSDRYLMEYGEDSHYYAKGLMFY